MKKAFDQTVRDLKRGVNKKVLKVPSIEQKVLDATSNEPWGPHGSLLADIAQATRNYHEYQIIMSVIWKRVNDTRKNWRHVYKALTVLEYLVAHGSERVIDDVREHANQISTLSDFQYINSSGKDQGNNVRKKSQSLVVLVNDKERIQEVRQKAATTRDKYRNNPVGSMYRPGSGGYGDRYDDDCYERRYGNRDDDSNGYGRDRDWGSHDDERYGQYGDSYGREGERYGRDYEERNVRDGYGDNDYRGRSYNIDDYNYSSRSRSADQDRNLRNEDEGQYSSRGSGAIADDNSQDGSSTGKRLDQKYSGQHLVASHNFEDGAGAARSPSYSDRDGESSLPNAPKESLVLNASSGHITATALAPTPPPASSSAPTPAPTSVSTPASVHPPASSQTAVQHSYKEVDGFDDFDPRGSSSVFPPTSDTVPATTGVEMDLLGSLSESFSPNSSALMPTSQPAMTSEADGSASVNLGATFEAALPADMVNNQPFDDPFGDGPFKAVPSTDTASSQPHIAAHTNSFNVNSSQRVNVHQSAPVNAITELGGTFHDANLPSDSAAQPPTTTQFPKQEPPMPSQEVDILADILPPPATSSVNTQAGYPVLPSESVSHNGFPQTSQPEFQSGLSSLTGHNVPQNSYQAQTGQHASFPTQVDQPSPQTSYPLQPAENVLQTAFTTHAMPSNYPVQAIQASQLGFHSQNGTMQPNLPNPNFYGTYNTQSVSTGPTAAYIVPPSSTGPATHQNFLTESSSAVPTASQMGPQPPQAHSSSLVAPVSTNPSSTGPAIAPQSSKDKFETKSTIWTDTLSRGLVDLNISGPKANPLSDIGVDFDAINRKEKRMEKPTTATITSTVTMGKAMGSGSGMGRTVANALRPPPNPVMASGMNVGMASGPGTGIGMGGYAVSQPLGRGTGMNMPGNMGMEMNMGVGHGVNMPQQMGFPPGYTMPGGYNHMTGTGYGQQPRGYW